MSIFKNMRIKKKLMCGFLIIAIITAIVGSMGTIGMQLLNKNEETLYREGVESLTGVNGMYAVIVEQRVELRGAIIYIDDAEKANESINKLRTREAEFDELYDKYLAASSGTDAKENDLLKSAMAIYNGQFKILKEQMIAALRSGDKAAAREAFTQTAYFAEQATEALHEMVTYGDQRAADIKDGDDSMGFILTAAMVILTVVAAILAILLGLYNAKVIAKPVANMANAAKTLSMGDLEVNISADSNDEIGDLAKAFKKMVEGIREQAVILGAVANGDYTVSVPVRSEKDVINQAILNLVNDGSSMMGELQTSSNQVTVASEQISLGAQGLASGSTEQAASIQELSGAIADFKEQVDQNANRSQKALHNCDTAGNLMIGSMQSMDQMLVAMAAIDESSRNITRVIKVIDDIAFQTNILALNAAVEAARAGQQGKGFAVVADEVRKLASKSAAAAKETAALIEGSAQRVSEGNKIVEKTNESLKAVGVTTSDNADIIGEMAKSLEFQTRAIEEINEGIEQVATVVQTNAATAEQSAASAEEMSAQAAVLNGITSRFKVKRGTN